MKAKLFKSILWLIAVIDFLITVILGGCLNLVFGVAVHYYRKSAKYWRTAWSIADINRLQKQTEKLKRKLETKK